MHAKTCNNITSRVTSLSDNQIAQIKDLYACGIPKLDICQQFHIGRKRLNNIV